MARWLLVGEGPTEVGDEHRGRFLRTLLEQLAEDARAVPPDMEYRTGCTLARQLRLDPPQPKGMARVAVRALRAAGALRCDAVIVLVDNDHRLGRREELRHGSAGSDGSVRHSCGVAKETVEAWLLADGEAVPAPSGLPGKPEDLWGKPHDPTSHHPKQVYMRLSRDARLALDDVLSAWDADRACERAPWLRDFRDELLALIRECCPPSQAPRGT